MAKSRVPVCCFELGLELSTGGLIVKEGACRRRDPGWEDRRDREYSPGGKARDVIDARGLYVVPGLVDMHTHIYYGGGSVPAIEADPVAARSGVTTWVDAGSFAYDNVAGFRRYIVDRTQVRVFGFVYLYPASRDPEIDAVKRKGRSRPPTVHELSRNPSRDQVRFARVH